MLLVVLAGGADVIGRTYLERGNPVVVLVSWVGKGPRNVLIRRESGELVVRPFRGLRRPAGYLYRGQPGLAETNAAILADRLSPEVPAGLPDTPETTAARRDALEQAVFGPFAPCGTPGAYRRHLRRGEQPDGACRAAESASRTQRRSAQRARRRAARRKASAA